MEQKKLTSAQKRRIFEKRMGKMLFPHGFFLKDHRFYKIIPGEVVIMVGLHLAAYSDPWIIFATVPFCADAELLRQETGFFDAVSYWSNDEWSYGRPFEQALDIEFDDFEQRFFKHLISIRSVHDLYPFEVYLENMAYRNPKPWYRLADKYDFEVAIRTQNYDVAMERLQNRYELRKERVEDCRKRLATKHSFALKCPVKSYAEYRIAEAEEELAKALAEAAPYERWIHQLETGDYAELNAMIDRTIEESTQIYKEKFGKHYPGK